MPSTEHKIVPVGTLARITTTGIVHRITLEFDYTAGDRGLAEARVASWIQREADRYGIVARSKDITYHVETEDIGILGFEDSFRRSTLVGVWTMDLGPAPAYSLRYGPAHGLTGRVEGRDLKNTLYLIGHRSAFTAFTDGDTPHAARVDAEYVLAGFDPGIGCLVYDHRAAGM